nr:synaptobrevin, longin-like domain protein [Tanacetum cinerariifolium]
HRFSPDSGFRRGLLSQGTKVLSTVDGKLSTVSESSIRRNLKLNDEARISSLSDAELFENITLMGYNISPNQKFTFQKGQFSYQWKYLIHTIMQCLSPKSTGFNEFSSNIATALVCLATNRIYNFLKMIFDGMVRNVNNKVSKFLMYPRFLSKCLKMVTMGEGLGTPTKPYHTPSPEAQQTSPTTHSSPSLLPVTTEPLPTVIPSDDPLLGNIPKELGLLKAYQDRANIPKTSTLPSDSTPRVTSLAADEGRRRLDEGEEAAKRVSDYTKEMETVLTSMDIASILTSGGVQVVPTAAEVATATVSIPTGSGVVSTASPTIPTASPIFTTATESTPYIRRKGKERMVESETPNKKKVQEQIDVQLARELEEEMARDAQRINEQIAQDVEIARIHAKEELEMLIDGLDRNNETVAKYLQEYYQFAVELPFEKRIQLISDLVKYQDHYAKIIKYHTQQRKPLSRKQQKKFYMSVLKSHAGWKARHFKGMTLEEIREKFDLVWKRFQDFIQIGSKEEAERFKRKDLRLEQESVKKLKTSKEVKATEEVPEEKVKEMMQLVPVEETHTQNLMHAPVEWKLYDTCWVHHVSTKDQDIFMLIEKDYPLRKGLAIVMISYKLQVEIYSQMANDLILKIYKIANCPRQQDD